MPPRDQERSWEDAEVFGTNSKLQEGRKSVRQDIWEKMVMVSVSRRGTVWMIKGCNETQNDEGSCHASVRGTEDVSRYGEKLSYLRLSAKRRAGKGGEMVRNKVK